MRKLQVFLVLSLFLSLFRVSHVYAEVALQQLPDIQNAKTFTSFEEAAVVSMLESQGVRFISPQAAKATAEVILQRMSAPALQVIDGGLASASGSSAFVSMTIPAASVAGTAVLGFQIGQFLASNVGYVSYFFDSVTGLLPNTSVMAFGNWWIKQVTDTNGNISYQICYGPSTVTTGYSSDMLVGGQPPSIDVTRTNNNELYYYAYLKQYYPGYSDWNVNPKHQWAIGNGFSSPQLSKLATSFSGDLTVPSSSPVHVGQPYTFNFPNPNVSTDPLGDAVSNPDATVSPVNDVQPAPVPNPQPDPNQIPNPIPQPEPSPAPEPAPAPSDYSVPSGPAGIDWSPLQTAWDTFTRKFPFSIPWDIARQLSIFNVTPHAPKFHVHIPIDLFSWHQDMDFDIDFTPFEPYAEIARWFLLIIWDVGVALAVRKLMPE